MKRSVYFAPIAALMVCIGPAQAQVLSKAEKVQQLQEFFGVKDSAAFSLQAAIVRVQNAGRVLSEQALSKMPPVSRAVNEAKVQSALNQYLSASSIGNLDVAKQWEAFVAEQATDEEIEAAAAFFRSPAGRKFMGVKGVADSIASSSISRRIEERARPALDQLSRDLDAIR